MWEEIFSNLISNTFYPIMSSMLNEQMHEFWLEDYPVPGRYHEFYRLALGELIDATERQTFKPGWKHPDLHTKSGSIGFMDLAVREQSIPKERAIPYPNPNNSPYLEHVFASSEYERRKALTILVVGIEPAHRGVGRVKPLLSTFYQRVEELAVDWELDTIVIEMIQSHGVRKTLPKVGFTLYDRGNNAVKRLNNPHS